MSKTKSVGFAGHGPQSDIWVYDVGLAVLLAQMIRFMEVTPLSLRPAWWHGWEEVLRIHAKVSDFYFDLVDLPADASAREEFAALADHAADQLLHRGTLTPEDAAAWKAHDELPVIFRGPEPLETAPIARRPAGRLTTGADGGKPRTPQELTGSNQAEVWPPRRLRTSSTPPG